jgi:hypothetical protein
MTRCLSEPSVVLLVGLVGASGCRSEADRAPPPPAETTRAARALVRSLEERFGPGLPAGRTLIRPTEDPVVDRAGEWLRLRSAAGGPRVAVPARGDGPVRLHDPASGMTLEVSLRGGSPAPADVVGDVVVYRGGLGRKGDTLQRLSADGLEDYVSIAARPARPELAYDVELGERVAGLRLVEGTLEFLDAGGAPRWRVARPYLVSVDGRRHGAELQLAGCAADTNLAAPWGRPPVPPGARRCTLLVRWSPGMVYPILVDPGWIIGSSMLAERSVVASVVLSDGRILVAGGAQGPDVVGVPIAGAEIYDPATDSWAVTGSMNSARMYHSVARLPDGRVLVTGATLRGEIYDPATAQWTPTGLMVRPRSRHVSLTLPDGRVLVAGGEIGSPSAPTYLAHAEVFDPATGSFAAAPAMLATRSELTGTLLASGQVLVTGGKGSDRGGVELFDPAAGGGVGAWRRAGTMTDDRDGHAAVRLADGRVFITGGHKITQPFHSQTSDYFDPTAAGGLGGLVRGPDLYRPRWGHAMVEMLDGSVLLTGGAMEFASTEILRPSVQQFQWAGALVKSRWRHAAHVLASGRVMAVGGNAGSTYHRTTEHIIFESGDRFPDGTTCSLPGACASLTCVDGLCCDQPCPGICNACNVDGAEGRCTDRDTRGTTNFTSCGAYHCNGSGPDCPASCSASRDCIGGHYCVDGACVPTKPVGTSCTSHDECLNGCWDGVCCETTCSGSCNRCDLPGWVGRCLPVASGSPGEPSCSPYVCSGGPSCPTTCASDAVCAPGHFCNAGVCTAKKDLGGGCGAANWCNSGFCVDGVCCDSACGGQCAHCNRPGAPGTCTPVTGAPIGRPACAGGAGTCGGACDGVNPDACAYPGAELVCRTATCSVDVATSAAACDGAGNCPASVVTSCQPYVCGSSACRNACTSDSHCTSGHYCAAGACVPRLANGQPCSSENQCQSAFCTDGVCCGTLCAGGAGDCQACSAAAGAPADGTCAPVGAGRVCRPATAPCDAAEVCSGTSAACPADQLVPAGVTCRPAANACDVSERCTGTAMTCPVDLFVKDGTKCNDSNGCTTQDSCKAGVCSGRPINGCR